MNTATQKSRIQWEGVSMDGGVNGKGLVGETKCIPYIPSALSCVGFEMVCNLYVLQKLYTLFF